MASCGNSSPRQPAPNHPDQQLIWIRPWAADRPLLHRGLHTQPRGGLRVIRGRVLEVQEAVYTQRFGDPASIERIDVLDIDPDNPDATVVADLADAPNLPSDAFDCVICTQTLLLIYDVHAAVRTLHRVLKPGGTALVTVPGISRICRPDERSHNGRLLAIYDDVGEAAIRGDLSARGRNGGGLRKRAQCRCFSLRAGRRGAGAVRARRPRSRLSADHRREGDESISRPSADRRLDEPVT